MTRQDLISTIYDKKSFLCVGLDTDRKKIPAFLRDDPDAFFRFNKSIIDATVDLCVGYKINTAFYEVEGIPGWQALEKTLDYIPSTHFTIADAKRGDIGNTGKKYAQTFFQTYDFDAITVAPYMGSDSVGPFLEWKNKWTIVLGLTSNKGAEDFQFITGDLDRPLYRQVVDKCMDWGSPDQMMFVTGATKASYLKTLREDAPHYFFLVPGVGSQGGSLDEVVKNAFIPDECGLLVNSSRGIIYAGGDKTDFDQEVRKAALDLQQQMATYLL